MKAIIFLITVLCAYSASAKSQNPIGVLPVVNYNRFEYKADAQTWGIGQDKNGILYFANNDGLLTFDGNYWKLYPLPNNAPVRSLAIDNTGKIYAGGQDEIGYFFPDKNGKIRFNSLKHLVPPGERQFADILGITITRNGIFFRTSESIFQLKNNIIHAFDAPGGWRLLAEAGPSVFAVDKTEGLLEFKNEKWQSPINNPVPRDWAIAAITHYNKDTLLIATLKNGLYLLRGSALIKKTTQIDEILQNSHISCILEISGGRYVIGTPADGCYIIDRQGRLERKISQEEGLQSGNIISLLSDHDQNLWFGLGNGIDFISYNSAVTWIYPGKNNTLTSNAARIFDGKLFIGTSNGLFSTPVSRSETDISRSSGTFTEVENTKGAVLNLAEISGHLLLGHQEGSFLIQNNKAIQISSRHGAWNFIPCSPDNVVAGTYTGLQLLDYHNNGFKDSGKISGIYESLRFLAFDNDHTIWASHPYRGVFRLELSADRKKIIKYTHYSKEAGLPSSFNNYIYRIRKRIVVATGNGLYEYDQPSNRFKPSSFFRQAFGSQSIKYLAEDSTGNIWFISDQRTGVLDFQQGSSKQPFTKIYLPELTAETISEYGYIYPYNRENIFIGSGKGLFHINYSHYVKSSPKLKVLLRTVKAINKRDSLLFGGYFCNGTKITGNQNSEGVISLSNAWNSFHFEYSSTLYAQKNTIEYSYKLEGFDKEWSDWSDRTEKDYTNLSFGTYTFLVKARNNLGNVSGPVSYTFKVLPAWYQSIWAFILYLACLAFTIYLLVQRQKRRFARRLKKLEEEQNRLNYLHQLELDRTEKEVVELQNKSLETEVNFKNKELATVTMHLVERGKMLTKVKEELGSLSRKMNLPAGELKPIFRILGDEEKNEKDWDQFAVHFDEIHHNFLFALKTKFPTLSSTDLKLCAYLRINLSSKEIAQLMNISVKGVEISRYRLRKKLQLSTEINLFDFLIQIHG